MDIPLSNPDISDLEREYAAAVLRTTSLSLGPKVPEFEQKIADYIGVDHAIAMSSGTAALHVIVAGLGIGEGDVVLTTPFSFISTANCLLFERAEPVFVDIDENTWNITPEKTLEVFLSLPENTQRRVKGIIYVDVFGVPADGTGFEALAEARDWFLIEDSAESLGSVHQDRMCGSFGHAAILAFYPNKQITTGEGGMLLTSDDHLADLSRSLRNQGRDIGAGWLQHSRLGYNYRMSDINAAIGIAQMERIDEILSRRKRVKTLYDQALNDLFQQGELIPQKTEDETIVSPFVYVVRLPDTRDRKDRDEILNTLRSSGIACSNYFTPIHLQPHFQNRGWKFGDMPVTERIAERTIALPFFNRLGEDDIGVVADRLKRALRA